MRPRGDGRHRPLVLLPGMMCDARLFGPQIEALGADADISVADLSQDDTVEGMAARVLAAAPPRFALAGLSMGGIVAMEVARRAPERVERLALLDANHRGEAPERRALRAPQIERVASRGLGRVVEEELLPYYLAPDCRDAERIAELVMAMALDLGPAAFDRQSRALRERPDQTETLKGIGCPVLLLCGEHDRLCPPSRHTEMADLIRRARLRIVPGAGHLPTLESPEEVSEALRRWLRQGFP